MSEIRQVEPPDTEFHKECMRFWMAQMKEFSEALFHPAFVITKSVDEIESEEE